MVMVSPQSFRCEASEVERTDYTLIWDQRLVQTLRVHPPMDYTAPPPVKVSKVTQEHLYEVRKRRCQHIQLIVT